MDFDVPDRIHIMPVGYEEERVTTTAIEYRADKVVLIGHKEDGPQEKERLVSIREKLEENSIIVEETQCDIFDLYDSLGLIGELITEFEDDNVYVNVSSGSKITAIAGMIACMAIDATAYYAKARDYSMEAPEGIEFVQELPRYPINAPERQQVEMLYVVSEMTSKNLPPTKGKLIHVAEHLGMPFITNKGVQDKGKYRIIDNEILDPMQEQGYITITREGRSKLIELTEEGENSLRAFRYLIDDSEKEAVEEVIMSDRIA